MTDSPIPIEPVRKTRTVPLGVTDAFELFTSRMDTWWPLTSHSISGDGTSTVRFEAGVGGRIVEVTSDGVEYSWADVVTWDPPQLVAVAWHPSIDPDASTTLEVRFHVVDEEHTEIELEHRGWEALGAEEGARRRAGYQSGWDTVLSELETASAPVAHE